MQATTSNPMASESITIENKVPRCTAFVPKRETDDEPWRVQVQIDDHNVLFAQGRDWDKARDAACVQIVYLIEALNGLRAQLQKSYMHTQLPTPADDPYFENIDGDV